MAEGNRPDLSMHWSNSWGSSAISRSKLDFAVPRRRRTSSMTLLRYAHEELDEILGGLEAFHATAIPEKRPPCVLGEIHRVEHATEAAVHG